MADGKILVVDDDTLSAELVRQCLQHKGYTVAVAPDGLTASRALAAEPPDLIILDLMLPGLDGWELCSMIRTLPDPALSALPIIMLTSRSTEQDRLRGLRAGADDYIIKPFSLEELALKVGRLLARRAGTTRPARGAEPRPREEGLDDVYDMFHHELKNHLVAISAFAHRLDLQVDTISRDALKRYVGFIRKSSDHLNSIVEEVLWFRRIQAGSFEVELEPLALKETVKEVLALSTALAREKHVDLRDEVWQEAPPVRFHPGAAKICLTNLVENAVKYTPERGTVTVRLRPAGDGAVALEVEDTGPGIPPDEREQVFEKFYRGRGVARSTKGTGLGLYVVRSLARALGAEVTVEPGPGGGSCFRLEFAPAGETGKAATAARPRA